MCNVNKPSVPQQATAALTRRVCAAKPQKRPISGDLLIAALQGLSARAFKAREYGIVDHYVDSFAPRAFFSTLTNVNFDSPRIVGYAREAIALREALKAQCLNADASARVDNPMAELQLVSDDWASYSVRPQNSPQIRTKRQLARTSSACACCACTV